MTACPGPCGQRCIALPAPPYSPNPQDNPNPRSNGERGACVNLLLSRRQRSGRSRRHAPCIRTQGQRPPRPCARHLRCYLAVESSMVALAASSSLVQAKPSLQQKHRVCRLSHLIHRPATSSPAAGIAAARRTLRTTVAASAAPSAASGCVPPSCLRADQFQRRQLIRSCSCAFNSSALNTTLTFPPSSTPALTQHHERRADHQVGDRPRRPGGDGPGAAIAGGGGRERAAAAAARCLPSSSAWPEPWCPRPAQTVAAQAAAAGMLSRQPPHAFCRPAQLARPSRPCAPSPRSSRDPSSPFSPFPDRPVPPTRTLPHRTWP